MDIVNIKRILVVRNDSTTNWEKTTYILKRGEIGVGYMQTEMGEKPVIKVGDGINHWIALPQNEYILQEDQILTSDFGRHKIENGYVNAGGYGLSLSEWIFDALKTSKPPVVIKPILESRVIEIFSVPSREIGSKVTSISWEGKYRDGWYEFGSTESVEDKSAGTNAIYSISYNGEQISDALNGTHTLNEPIVINQLGNIDCGTLYIYCAYNNARIPLNNKGHEVPEYRIGDSHTENIHTCSVTGYREGCFYGAVTIKDFDESKITSQVIRGLDGKLSADYSGQSDIHFLVPSGSTAFIIATPKLGLEDYATCPVKVFNNTAQANMWNEGNFKRCQISVGAADSTEDSVGEFAEIYNVYYYIPAHPYEKDAEIILNLSNVEKEEESNG